MADTLKFQVLSGGFNELERPFNLWPMGAETQDAHTDDKLPVQSGRRKIQLFARNDRLQQLLVENIYIAYFWAIAEGKGGKLGTR
jgi:hypothetical protein